MNTKLISICIATYNRADYISETLDSIIPQLDDDIELLIVDGASTDNTEEIVTQYVIREPRIRYIRLSAKGGIDQDYDKSVELASGEYCWFFTDDDIIKPGGVTAVKSAVKEGHDLIVVNGEMRNRVLSAVLEWRRIKIKNDRVYPADRMESLFAECLLYLSFIGAVVIRRSVWLSRDRSQFFGTEFIHVGVIFQKPLTGTALLISNPYIIIRYGNAQWSSRSFDIWMFKWPRMVWSFEHISDYAKSCVCSSKPWMSLKSLVFQRSVNRYNRQVYRRYFKDMKVNIIWKFTALFIACFPRKIIIPFHYLYSVLKGPEARAAFQNLFPESN